MLTQPTSIRLGVTWAIGSLAITVNGGTLTFEEPRDGDVFVEGQAIPIVLAGFAPDEVYLNADVFADGTPIGTATFCCPLCPCALPTPGVGTVLQIPFPWGPNDPPRPQPWQGWADATPGIHTLTATATGANGQPVAARSIQIFVAHPHGLDVSVRAVTEPEHRLEFVIPEGSLVPGGFRMEMSRDFVSWQRLGDFEPGNVAAFFSDRPDPNDVQPRFYRAVRIR